jgi:extradiol dioxygenase family protein
MTKNAPLIHIALPTADKQMSMAFYRDTLNLPTINMANTEYSVDFYGHNLAFHESKNFILPPFPTVGSKKNKIVVSGFHLGIILTKELYNKVVNNLRTSNIVFAVEPQIANQGTEREQKYCFIKDPDGYTIEIKQVDRPYSFNRLPEWSLQGNDSDNNFTPD